MKLIAALGKKLHAKSDKLYFRGTRMVGEDGMEGGRRHSKDLRTKKTACGSCLNIFIFSLPFTC